MSVEFPLVSVLMTAYNRAQYIAASIESVLASTYTNFELIIVDDCSTDDTVAIAKNYAQKDSRLKLFVNKENLGDYPNRNKAAAHATGKYIKYLDSDDLIYAHGLEVMVTAMEEFPTAGFGLSAISDAAHSYPHCINMHTAYLEHFGAYGHFGRAPGSSIILKKAFDQVGGFSGKRMIGDNELWFTLGRYYPLVKLPRDLVWDRVHDSQESKSEYATAYETLRKEVMNAALAHADCPLNAAEIEAITKAEKRKSIKQIIRKWL